MASEPESAERRRSLVTLMREVSVEGMEASLEFFIEIIGGKVGVKLSCY